MSKILVTGGVGYIGSHTVVELISGGYEVLIVDNLSNSNVKILDQLKEICGIKPHFIEMDLCNASAVKALSTQHQDIAGIIHFAAYKAVGESVQKPIQYYQNNFVSLLNILEFFPSVPIVFSSSCTVYGEPDELPVTELSKIKKANSPYGNTKQVCEEILLDAAIADPNLKVICLRYFNPVGAHESGLIGELPNGVPQNLVPFITQSAMGIRGAIQVYGDDYPTPDGSAIRDYIHVSDVAAAHVSALNFFDSQNSTNNFEVFNVGTGRGYSVLEIIHAFEEVTEQKLQYKIVERRTGDAIQIYGEVSKAEKALNWKARRDLKEMMQSAWKWQKYMDKQPF